MPWGKKIGILNNYMEQSFGPSTKTFITEVHIMKQYKQNLEHFCI